MEHSILYLICVICNKHNVSYHCLYEHHQSGIPTLSPTLAPTVHPTTKSPTSNPTNTPTIPTVYPSQFPTQSPTEYPTTSKPTTPSVNPTAIPSMEPTFVPTSIPTTPSLYPSAIPTSAPSLSPSKAPTSYPTMECETLRIHLIPIQGDTLDDVAMEMLMNPLVHKGTLNGNHPFWKFECDTDCKEGYNGYSVSLYFDGDAHWALTIHSTISASTDTPYFKSLLIESDSYFVPLSGIWTKTEDTETAMDTEDTQSTYRLLLECNTESMAEMEHLEDESYDSTSLWNIVICGVIVVILGIFIALYWYVRRLQKQVAQVTSTSEVSKEAEMSKEPGANSTGTCTTQRSDEVPRIVRVPSGAISEMDQSTTNGTYPALPSSRPSTVVVYEE